MRLKAPFKYSSLLVRADIRIDVPKKDPAFDFYEVFELPSCKVHWEHSEQLGRSFGHYVLVVSLTPIATWHGFRTSRFKMPVKKRQSDKVYRSNQLSFRDHVMDSKWM